MNKRTKIIVSVLIVLAVALTTWYMSYPEQKEPVEIGFANTWPIEKANISIEIHDELIEGIPVVKFEYNDHGYTTLEGGKGLTVNPKKESFNDLLKYVENGSISQTHATTFGGKVCAVYVLIDNGQVYFSTEDLIEFDASNYEAILEKKNESRTIVHFDHRMALTFILTVLVTALSIFIVLAMLWIKPPSSKEES